MHYSVIRARSIGMGGILAHRVDMEKGAAASKRAACIAAAKSASDRRWTHPRRSGMPIAREDPCWQAVRSRQCMSPDIGSVLELKRQRDELQLFAEPCRSTLSGVGFTGLVGSASTILWM